MLSSGLLDLVSSCTFDHRDAKVLPKVETPIDGSDAPPVFIPQKENRGQQIERVLRSANGAWVSSPDLAAALGIRTDDVAKAMRGRVAEGQVFQRRKHSNNGHYFWRIDPKTPVTRTAGLGKEGEWRRNLVLGAIESSGQRGIGKTEIVLRLGISMQSVRHHTRALADLGLVHLREHDGKHPRWHAGSGV